MIKLDTLDIQCKKGWNFQDDSIVIEAGDSFAFDTVNNRRNKYRKNQYCTADYVVGFLGSLNNSYSLVFHIFF